MTIHTSQIKKNIKGQEINIPEDFKINDDKVYLKKVGNVIYIIPFHDPWKNIFDPTFLFTSDFLENRDQEENQK